MVWCKKAKAKGNAKRMLQENSDDFEILLANISSLEKGYSENLIGAREQQCEILKKLLSLTAWELLISKKEVEELRCFVEEAQLLVSYMDRDGKMKEVLLDEAKSFKCLAEYDFIEDEKLGQTCFGYCKRASVDYFIKKSIQGWTARMERYKAKYLNIH